MYENLDLKENVMDVPSVLLIIEWENEIIILKKEPPIFIHKDMAMTLKLLIS